MSESLRPPHLRGCHSQHRDSQDNCRPSHRVNSPQEMERKALLHQSLSILRDVAHNSAAFNINLTKFRLYSLPTPSRPPPPRTRLRAIHTGAVPVPSPNPAASFPLEPAPPVGPHILPRPPHAQPRHRLLPATATSARGRPAGPGLPGRGHLFFGAFLPPPKHLTARRSTARATTPLSSPSGRPFSYPSRLACSQLLFSIHLSHPTPRLPPGPPSSTSVALPRTPSSHLASVLQQQPLGVHAHSPQAPTPASGAVSRDQRAGLPHSPLDPGVAVSTERDPHPGSRRLSASSPAPYLNNRQKQSLRARDRCEHPPGLSAPPAQPASSSHCACAGTRRARRAQVRGCLAPGGAGSPWSCISGATPAPEPPAQQ